MNPIINSLLRIIVLVTYHIASFINPPLGLYYKTLSLKCANNPLVNLRNNYKIKFIATSMKLL